MTTSSAGTENKERDPVLITLLLTAGILLLVTWVFKDWTPAFEYETFERGASSVIFWYGLVVLLFGAFQVITGQVISITTTKLLMVAYIILYLGGGFVLAVLHLLWDILVTGDFFAFPERY